jgi:hypothetical protein
MTCESDNCRVDQHGETGRQSATLEGVRLCERCARFLAEEIEHIPRLYEECSLVLTGGSSSMVQERTSGGPLPGMPLNEAAVETRAAMLATLGAWSGLVAEERGLHAPSRAIPQLTRFLLRNFMWLAAHPAVADLEREVTQLVRRARRTIGTDPVRRVHVGVCGANGCEGSLLATLNDHHAGRPMHIRCDAEPSHSWASEEWTRLRRAMRRSSPTAECWLTAQDISRLWNTSIGTVYRLASEQGWRRRSRSGRTYYAEAEVHECFTRRMQASTRGREGR